MVNLSGVWGGASAENKFFPFERKRSIQWKVEEKSGIRYPEVFDFLKVDSDAVLLPSWFNWLITLIMLTWTWLKS